MTTDSWVLLAIVAILCLFCVYVMRSASQATSEERKRSSRDFERMTAFTREQMRLAQDTAGVTRAMAAEFTSALLGIHQGGQESTQRMVEITNSMISEIVSPQPPKMSEEQIRLDLAAQKDPWDLMLHPAEERERLEFEAGASGWSTGPLNPYAAHNMPAGAPGPVGEMSEMPGAMSPDR